MFTACHSWPPSWLAHKEPPKAHPSATSAKCSSDTPVVPAAPRVVGGGDADTQLTPRSTVCIRARQVPVEQEATPRTNPSSAVTKLADWARKPVTGAEVVVVLLGGVVDRDGEEGRVVVSARGAEGPLRAVNRAAARTTPAVMAKGRSSIPSSRLDARPALSAAVLLFIPFVADHDILLGMGHIAVLH
jgi:hypothetical protein